MTARYDTIGRSYTSTRRADPRIGAQINAAIGNARSVVNVGAGAGSYEPADRFVIAVDPSVTMIRQRAAPAAPAVLAGGEALPFADEAFDVALATLTLHHWSDVEGGLREMKRVSRRQVVFFFDAGPSFALWLIDDYFPEFLQVETERTAPNSTRLARTLDVRRIEVVPVPADCADGFGGAFWNRPEAYLDPVVQAGISSFALLDDDARARGTEKLRRDLESGAWDARHGALRAETEKDLGYRLLVAGLP